MIDHVTVRVSDFEASKAFYDCVLTPLGFGDARAKGALASGASSRSQRMASRRDNGPPGKRPVYHDYGAYVLDSDGNNVEAVFHER